MSELASQQNYSFPETSLVKTQPITVTENAASKIWELIAEEGNFQLKLRVYITGGGCSGFQYNFMFEETVNEDDTVIVKDNGGDQNNNSIRVQLLIDSVSLGFLGGAEIDYKSDLSGEQFIIRNPNAKATCGCGSSFSA